jgi:chromosome segregation ATPase
VSSTLDDHIRAAFDRIRVSLSGQLEADLSASTSDILRVVADEHRRALVEATEHTAATMRSEAEQQLAAAREEFARERDELARQKDDLARQREELQQSSTSEIAGLERALGELRDELDVARRTLDESQTTCQALEHAIDVQRQDIERVKQELEGGEATRRELQESIDRALSEKDQARVEFESVARELQGVRSRFEHTARLTSAFRTLDDATSLADGRSEYVRWRPRSPRSRCRRPHHART